LYVSLRNFADVSIGRLVFVVLIAFSAFCCCASAVCAQSVPRTDSPRSLGLGESPIADPSDTWSENAAFRFDTSAHVRTMLAPFPGGLPDSWTAGVAGDAPVDTNLTLGATFTRYASSNIFSWESIAAQVSKTFPVARSTSGERDAVVGVRVRYGDESFGAEYLPLDEMTVDLGAEFDLLPQVTAAAAVTHLLTLYNNQGIPMEAMDGWFGFSYRPLPEASIDAALELPEGAHAAVHGGIEYAFDAQLFIRVGTNTSTGEFSGGFGVVTGSFLADFSAVRNPQEGTSVAFAIGFNL